MKDSPVVSKAGLTFLVCFLLAGFWGLSPAFSATPGFSPKPFFIENQGQAPEGVRYYQAGPKQAVQFFDDGVQMALWGEGRAQPAVFSIRPQKVASPSQVKGQRELPGRVHYYLGQNPVNWKTGIPTFARVQYSGLLGPISWNFYFKENLLEYDLVCPPGTSPQSAKLVLEGVERVEILANGDMEMILADKGRVLQKAPRAWVVEKGQKRDVECSFRLNLKQEGLLSFGFVTGPYDPALELVIDPVLEWSTYLGGAQDDFSAGVALDSGGNVVVAGSTASSASFPVKNNFYPNYGGGAFDLFVAKYSPDGQDLWFATFIGGSGNDRATGLAMDVGNNIYVCGYTDSPDYPVQDPQPGGDSLSGGQDAVVTKLGQFGQSVPYSAYLGGSGDDQARAIAVDSQSQFFVTGQTASQDFPIMGGPIQPNFAGGNTDIFITRIFPILGGEAALHSSTYFGGSKDEAGLAIDVDNNWVVFSGWTNSPNENNPNQGQVRFPWINPIQKYDGTFFACRGQDLQNRDAFVARIKPSLKLPDINFCSCMGGTSAPGNVDQQAKAVRIAPVQTVVVAGYTTATNFPMELNSSAQPVNGGGTDGFVTWLDAERRLLLDSTYLGGQGYDVIEAVKLDSTGRVYATGSTQSADFPLAEPSQDALQGIQDAFVTKMAQALNTFLYSTYLGGSGWDWGRSITLTALSEIIVTGDTASNDFPTQSPLQAAIAGNTDVFVTKFKASPGPNPPTPDPDPDKDGGGSSCFVGAAR